MDDDTSTEILIRYFIAEPVNARARDGRSQYNIIIAAGSKTLENEFCLLRRAVKVADGRPRVKRITSRWNLRVKSMRFQCD